MPMPDRLAVTFALPTPEARGPLIDGVVLREFHLLAPPDAPMGATVVYRETAEGEAVGETRMLVLASDEMPESTALLEAIGAWVLAVLMNKGKVPAGTTAAVAIVAKPDEGPVTPEPGIRLG